jgi:hypothetical protein
MPLVSGRGRGWKRGAKTGVDNLFGVISSDGNKRTRWDGFVANFAQEVVKELSHGPKTHAASRV